MSKRGNEKKKEKLNPIDQAIAEYLEKLPSEYGLPASYIQNQINPEKIQDFMNKYLEKASRIVGEGYKPEADQNLIPELKKYLASGEALSEQLKKAGSLETALMQNNPDNRSFGQRFRDWFFGKKPEKQYDSSSVTPIEDLARLFESDKNYQALMPEVYSGVKLGAQAKYATNILKVAYGNKLISEEKARQGMRDSYKIMEKSKAQIGKGIESLLSNLSQVAAGIFGVLGILVLMMQLEFTGAVVGSDLSTSWGAYYGLGLILIALVMFVLLRKDLINEPKSQSKPVRKKIKKIKKSKVKPLKSKTLPKRTINKTKKHKKVKRR